MRITDKANGTALWMQRKRNWCRTPFTFTTYVLTDEEIDMQSGVMHQRFDVTKLYRVKDITIDRSLLQRIFGLSTITVKAGDAKNNNGDLEDSIVLKNVVNGYDVRKKIQTAVDQAKKNWRGVAHEFISETDDGIGQDL